MSEKEKMLFYLTSGKILTVSVTKDEKEQLIKCLNTDWQHAIMTSDNLLINMDRVTHIEIKKM